MEKSRITPWRKVRDVSIIALCWLTISPLMWIIRSKSDCIKKRSLVWLTVISPFTWGVLTFLFLVFGVPVLTAHSPVFASMIRSFPEFTGALTSAGNWSQLLLISYLLPVYSFCVVFLFATMAFTGWSYREASVQVCEYFEPWFCIIVALSIVILIFARWRKTDFAGKTISLVPVILECLMALFNFDLYRMRVENYEGMTTNQIFDYAVRMLIDLGTITGTNYITANVIVYILPLVAILLIGYLAWVILTVNRRPDIAILPPPIATHK